jgi:hypothetical protein
MPNCILTISRDTLSRFCTIYRISQIIKKCPEKYRKWDQKIEDFFRPFSPLRTTTEDPNVQPTSATLALFKILCRN